MREHEGRKVINIYSNFQLVNIKWSPQPLQDHQKRPWFLQYMQIPWKAIYLFSMYCQLNFKT